MDGDAGRGGAGSEDDVIVTVLVVISVVSRRYSRCSGPRAWDIQIIFCLVLVVWGFVSYREVVVPMTRFCSFHSMLARRGRRRILVTPGNLKINSSPRSASSFQLLLGLIHNVNIVVIRRQ